MKKRKFLPLLGNCQPQVLRRDLCEWFSSPTGELLLKEQTDILSAVMPRLFGYYCLHAGPVCMPKLRQMSTIKNHFRLLSQDEHIGGGDSASAVADLQVDRDNHSPCVGRLDALPFASKSLDAVVLHHSLDIENDPHSVLREACRVLLPGGSIVVVGFNPWSLWGLWRLLSLRTAFAPTQAPWGCHFVSPYRLSDWLNLLDFEVEGCETRFHFPVLGQKSQLSSNRLLSFAEHHLKSFGAAYILVAKKREVCMTPIKPAWHTAASPLRPAVAHARKVTQSSVSSLLEARQRRESDADDNKHP